MESAIRAVPPLIQVLILVGLAAYVTVSIAARVSPAFGSRVWDPERNPTSRAHYYQYTVIPTLTFLGSLAAVYLSWDSSRPWLGDWSQSKAIIKVALCIYAFGAIVIARGLGKRMDISDARKLRSWLPLVLMLSGLGALFGMVLVRLE